MTGYINNAASSSSIILQWQEENTRVAKVDFSIKFETSLITKLGLQQLHDFVI